MFSYLNNIKNLIYILKVRKEKLLFLLLLTFISSFTEIIGLSLIAPYVSKIFELNMLTDFKYLSFFNYNQDNYIYFASIIIVASFFLKGVFIHFYKVVYCKIFLQRVCQTSS